MPSPKRKPDAGGDRLPNAVSCCSAEKQSDLKPHALFVQAKSIVAAFAAINPLALAALVLVVGEVAR